jgi:DNA invertase Pin-like site-specific DNA recombinase
LEIVEKFEDTLRLAIAVTKLRESGGREHRRRIRIAKQIVDLANAVIAKEVRAAIEEPVGDRSRMTWQEVADTLKISKTTAYNRYGPGSN